MQTLHTAIPVQAPKYRRLLAALASTQRYGAMVATATLATAATVATIAATPQQPSKQSEAQHGNP